jgi:Zn-finger nucleic acid-binding protein
MNEKTASRCPACDGELQGAELLGQSVYLCLACDGLAASRSSLMKLWPPAVDTQGLGQEAARRFGADRRKPARKTRLNCPFCQGRMDISTFAAVEVDECSLCHGLWLDAPEVELLAKVLVPYKWKVGAARAKAGPGVRAALARAQNDVDRLNDVPKRRAPAVARRQKEAEGILETLKQKATRRGLRP